MKRFRKFVEDAGVSGSPTAANCVGSGNIDGIGIGPKGEPGISKKKQREHRRRARSVMGRLSR